MLLAQLVAMLALLSYPVVLDDGQKEPEEAPSVRRFKQWLEVFNAGDREALLRFHAENTSKEGLKRMSADSRADMDARLRDDTRGLELGKIEKATDQEVVATARMKQGGFWVRITLQLEQDAPYGIKGLGLRRIPAPEGTRPKGKLTDEQIAKELSDYLDSLVDADTFSGTVLVAKDGRPFFEKAYGLASRAYGVPNKLDTKFNLGSMNKMFTAVAIAQLAEAGKLSFDDKIGKYLTDFPVKDAAEKVTIHQLLTHTSGLGSFFNDEFMKASRDRFRSVKDYFPLIAKETLAFEPGARFSYSNTGFLVLGAIVEKASGQDYFDYVREHIYKPAGMVNTDAYELDQDVPNLAVGYTRMGAGGRPSKGPRTNNIFLHVIKGGPAGGGYSTVEDLLNFDRALRSHKLLGPKMTDLVLAGKVEVGRGSDSKYAYGFRDDREYGHRFVGHGGGFPGINARLDMDLTGGYTAVVLSNYDGGAEPVADKARDLITRD
jgi:CubicO group peptidase (beta-lactamase class C family)